MSRPLNIPRHAKRRCLERFGVPLTRTLHATLVNDIRAGRAVFRGMSKADPDHAIYLGTINRRPAILIFAPVSQVVVSVLRGGGSDLAGPAWDYVCREAARDAQREAVQA